MRRTLGIGTVFTMLVASSVATFQSSAAQSSAANAPEPLALVGANVVNVHNGRITPNATVVLRGGRIESIATGAAPGAVRTLDLKGKYVVPGLIDAHTHLADFGTARRALESGVTTVRSSGVSNYADVGLRALAKEGAIVGPDVLAAGYHVRPRLAEEAFLSDPVTAMPLMRGVETPDQIRQAVRMNLSHDVDWIKVLATERAGTPDTDPRKQVYTETELRAAVEEAATKNVPVQAHAHGDEGAMAAVKAGVRSIEHGTYLSDATLALMKERGTYFDPTYTTVIDVAEPGGDYDLAPLRLRGQHMLPQIADAVRRAHTKGVKIVAGSDTGYGPNSLTRISLEVANFVKLGLSPLEALQAATITNAEMLRIEKSTGALDVGFEADLIAVDGNPLERPDALQDVLLVISNGRIGLNRLDFAKTGAR
ncbi:MAG: amidohydrolase family protein [Vicinamibacterales bacterium]